MSPLELETLDQLLGDEMPLAVMRQVYPDDLTFAKSIHGLLLKGCVRLLTDDRAEVPPWRWRELFVEGTVTREMPQLTIELTDQGARYVS